MTAKGDLASAYATAGLAFQALSSYEPPYVWRSNTIEGDSIVTCVSDCRRGSDW
jgi:hypothetical protein